MSHKPTLADVATDFKRCVYISLVGDKFESDNFTRFFEHGKETYNELKNQLDTTRQKIVSLSLTKASNRNLEPNKRREHLLMVATLLK